MPATTTVTPTRRSARIFPNPLPLWPLRFCGTELFMGGPIIASEAMLSIGELFLLFFFFFSWLGGQRKVGTVH